MAIKWAFFSDASRGFRWEVRGAEGPIATCGKRFDDVDACVTDARTHGYSGADDPAVTNESNRFVRELRPAKTLARAP